MLRESVCTNKELLEPEILKYIKETEELVEFHNKNSRNALSWFNFLTIVNTVVSAGSIMCSSLLATTGGSAIDQTISNSIFSFSILVLSRLQTNFQFNLLCYQHLTLANDFAELNMKFKLLLYDIDSVTYRELVERFISIKEKNNLMRVRSYCLNKCC